MKHQLPDLDYLKQILVFKNPARNAAVARLSKAQTVWDLRDIARRRTPKGPFEYTFGAAENEVGLQRAYDAFRDVEFHPTILRDVSQVSTGWDVMGRHVDYPVGIAPTGFTRLMHSAGESAGARAAQNYGVPFALSTMGTTSPEDVRAAAPGGRLWFQLYVMKERERSFELVRRAREQGFDTLLLTVDTPVAGARHRDKRNGMSFPPQLTLKTMYNAAPRIEWWFNLLTTAPLEFAAIKNWQGTPGELVDAMFDPSLSFDDLAEIRDMWDGKIMIKGVQNVDDARRIADFGVDGIQLSNHGGRQLDRAPVPFRLLPEVVREVGRDLEIHIDTGIMSGADVVAAIAQGARYTQVGRAYMYGLMAGGEMGVNRMFSIITGEIERVMRLLGVSCLEELEPRHVTLLDRLRPRLSE
ncbi:alpha-hydroxy-acid oxidizing protein [Brevibacterium sp. 50QC2O2]|jgi:L-lactate dehydrogenase (cytochrome)|uniref:alpha-hydroxy acid oxidase n=1 Tax=Brevibacterium TaxID=1696 RepID=UPI00211CB5CC|nr:MULTISPECIES: alpha-hydroxy acid oxidase [unclassified Brevibacterium]MCQ9384367.1 alpha-hydroxy-acid oxidizing protein [Brevibacterium sp. 68QC2CO]MCQ9389604.1 alpha-hydroxy-acid oxidizing protein [Brevibacterium sp. 50QC2O2]